MKRPTFLRRTSALGGAALAPALFAAAADAQVPPGFQSRRYAVNGIELHAVTGGHGPALVLLSGWPETWYAWRLTLPALAAHYSVIVPDLRGMGLSSHPEDGYDKKTQARDIADVMDAAEG